MFRNTKNYIWVSSDDSISYVGYKAHMCVFLLR